MADKNNSTQLLMGLAVLTAGYFVYKRFGPSTTPSATSILFNTKGDITVKDITPPKDTPPKSTSIRNEMYNMAGGQPASWNWWAEFYNKATGKEAPSVNRISQPHEMFTVDEWIAIAFPGGLSGLAAYI